jgi:CheY-like chemotaxis protein
MVEDDGMETNGSRVLLAEDDRFLRRAAEVELRKHGYVVLAAADGEEALRIAMEQIPDIILLDLIMPKMHGFEVLRKLKQQESTAKIPVVIMSNLGQEQDVQQAMADGAMAYLIKSDLSLKDLSRNVEQALKGNLA